MTTKVEMKSIQKNAKIAGVLYLLIAVLAGFVHFYVPGKLFVAGDATTTVNNIMASEGLFRLGMGVELVLLLSEIVLTLLLYVLLKPVNKTLSLTAATFRLAMTIIHGINLVNYAMVLLLLSGAGYLAVFQSDQLHALVRVFIDAYTYGFAVGIVFFSLHVMLTGYLIIKSGYLPKVLGYLFLVASLGYLIDNFLYVLVENHMTGAVYFALPIAIAEIAFPIWLLIKGVNARQWEAKSALESA